ncbi:helix-turn-helix domain-containing protein [Hyphomicrobium sp.]|uniref:helix-turn-helix domain-containing protein n=1 Tax=Hyphomicrobium sp. TaxID=82 RepID=UPI002E2EEB37|nr:helix-turn-helix domain-containing protein [Hyphomicrobium sp.]HEX2843338.1 helix-turn-helix domain-containing protein [Hyphomicrobium sp.]
MNVRSGEDCASVPGGDPANFAAWFVERPIGHAELHGARTAGESTQGRLSEREALRLRHIIEAAIGEVFGVAHVELSRQSRGKAPVALARQAAMYLAHVSCGLNLTDVGLIFSRDRTTVAHACAVIEDRRDDPVFDRALELMEWIVPTLVGRRLLHAHHDT